MSDRILHDEETGVVYMRVYSISSDRTKVAQMTVNDTGYKVFVTGSVTVQMYNQCFSQEQIRWCSAKNCRFPPQIPDQFSFITPTEWDLI